MLVLRLLLLRKVCLLLRHPELVGGWATVEGCTVERRKRAHSLQQKAATTRTLDSKMFFARINTMARRRSLQRREVTHAKGLTGAAPRAPRGSRGAVVPLAALALALAALLAGVARVDAAKTLSFDEDQPADPRSCACSDVDPHANFTNGQVEFSCYQQVGDILQ